MKEKNQSAVELGKRSAEVRFKGKTKKERSALMRIVRNKGKLDERSKSVLGL